MVTITTTIIRIAIGVGDKVVEVISHHQVEYHDHRYGLRFLFILLLQC
jgi:hypothetical protein